MFPIAVYFCYSKQGCIFLRTHIHSEIIKDEQGLYTVLPKKTNQSSKTNSVTLRPIPRDIPTGEDISPASLSIETEHDHYP